MFEAILGEFLTKCRGAPTEDGLLGAELGAPMLTLTERGRQLVGERAGVWIWVPPGVAV